MRRSDLAPAVRRTLVRLPPPHDAHHGVVPAPPPEGSVPLPPPVAARHAEALAAMARVEALAAELADPWVVARLLPRREAVASSAIEGTHSTLDELLAAEEAEDGGIAASEATRQVRGYALALEAEARRAAEVGPDVFTADLVARLHAAVVRDDPDYPDPPGALRDRVVWIGGASPATSVLNPPPPALVPRLLGEGLAYMRAEGLQAQTQSVLTRMAVAHAHFEAVHPFRDGNGRVGRLLLPLAMAAEGATPLYLATHVEANRKAYYDALGAAQRRLAWHEAVGFFADAVVGTVEELMATRRALAAITGAWARRRDWRAGSAARRALDLLPGHPVATVAGLAARLGVSFPAAANAARQLAEAGVLVEATGRRRGRLFSAREVLAVLNRPYGDDPPLRPDARRRL